MRALVVMSGGQDSTTCLGVALSTTKEVIGVTFAYGQKHKNEVDHAKFIAAKWAVEHLVIDLSPILQNMKSSALITHGDTTEPHKYLPNLPASFVPARNALFLTTAYGLAMEYDCQVIYAGMCETDYSGYPDCRDSFIKALNLALNLGYKSEIEIITPLMFLDKADTFLLAANTNMLDTVINDTMTCYDGVADMHDWGMGCGECPACALRKKGWGEYRQRYTAQEA